MLQASLIMLFGILLVAFYAQGKPFSAKTVEKAGTRARPMNRFVLEDLSKAGASKSQAYRDALE